MSKKSNVLSQVAIALLAAVVVRVLYAVIIRVFFSKKKKDDNESEECLGI